jgi:dihydroneopterin aldolase
MGKTTRRVGLEGVKFNASIGFFEEERILKNNFLVDVDVLFTQNDVSETEDLSQTVDYGLLYQICEKAFAEETLLIETVAQKILVEIQTGFSFIDEIHIKIKKLNPPIKAQIQHSFIEINYKK